MATYAAILGFGLMALAGGIALLIVLGITYYFVGVLGTHVFKRIRRIYHLRVIGYWLDRLEKNGTHIFEKAEADATQAAPAAASTKESAS